MNRSTPLLSFRDIEQQIGSLLWLRQKKRDLLQKAHSGSAGARPGGTI